MSKNYIAAVLFGVSVFAVSSASSVSRDAASEPLSYDGIGVLQVAENPSGRPQVQVAENPSGRPQVQVAENPSGRPQVQVAENPSGRPQLHVA